MPLALVLWLLVPAGASEVYRWTDDAGTEHFTDNFHNIPAKQRPRVEADRWSLPAPAPSSERPIALAKEEVGYVVDAVVGGREPARLVVDTGASVTVLSPALVRRLGAKVEGRPRVLLRTASGEVEAEGWAEVGSLEVGGHRVAPLRVVVHDAVPPADGLLGMSFLGQFRMELRPSGPELLLGDR